MKLLALPGVGSGFALWSDMSFDDLLGPATSRDLQLASSSPEEHPPQSQHEAPLFLHQERTYLGMGRQILPEPGSLEYAELWGDTRPEPPLPRFAIKELRSSLAARALPALVPLPDLVPLPVPVLAPAPAPAFVPAYTPAAPTNNGKAHGYSTQEIDFFTVGEDLISDATTLRNIKLRWWQRIGIPRRH